MFISVSSFTCAQAMLAGDKTLIRHGMTRDTYLVEFGEGELVVKTRREDFRDGEFDANHSEAAALDTVSVRDERCMIS